MALRILVAEDDRQLAGYVRKALVEQHHAVDLAYDGEEAWLLAGTEGYDLIILDIMLPKRSGLDVLRDIRQQNHTVPVLLLTARDSTTDKISGLDLGADDYMTKPFSMQEFLARVRALSRRKGDIEDEKYACGDLVLDARTHQVHRGEREVELTAKEFALLQYLLAHQGTIVTRSDIIEKVWDVNFDMFSDVLKVVISRLRKKLEVEGEEILIHTVRGVGYIMKESEKRGAEVKD